MVRAGNTCYRPEGVWSECEWVEKPPATSSPYAPSAQFLQTIHESLLSGMQCREAMGTHSRNVCRDVSNRWAGVRGRLRLRWCGDSRRRRSIFTTSSILIIERPVAYTIARARIVLEGSVSLLRLLGVANTHVVAGPRLVFNAMLAKTAAPLTSRLGEGLFLPPHTCYSSFIDIGPPHEAQP